MVSGLNSVKCVCVRTCALCTPICVMPEHGCDFSMSHGHTDVLAGLHTLEHPVTGSYNAAFTFRMHICMLDPAQIGNSHSNPKVQW